MPKTVLVPIADGTEEIEAICIIDVLRRAGANVTVASVTLDLSITASRGVKLVADRLLKDCLQIKFDLIVLPGGMPGAEHLRDSHHLKKLLEAQQKENRLYGAICAAPVVVLQHHGLLGKRQATCYPGFEDKLKNADTTGQKVVVDGNCVTSRGPGTALEFAIKLIELLYSEKKSKEIAKDLLMTI
ncbi:MAG: DJ-1 family glyoxalase III [Planctomycetota bacterium]